MENVICLRLIDGTWNAWFIGAHASEIRRLFGTDVLPTDFTAAEDGISVREQIAKFHPGVRVTVDTAESEGKGVSNMAKRNYIVVRDEVHGTNFLVSESGLWSNEFPDARHYTFADAKRRAREFQCRVYEAKSYGDDGVRAVCNFEPTPLRA